MSDTPVVAVDRFPVDVIAPGGMTYRTCRLIMTQPVDGVGRLKVWSAPGVLVVDTDFLLEASNIGPKQADWHVATGAESVVVRSSPGCGCGNPLKWWSPPEFQPYRMGQLK